MDRCITQQNDADHFTRMCSDSGLRCRQVKLDSGASLKISFLTQLRHAPPTPTNESKHPQLCVRAEDNEHECNGFLCRLAPVWVRVGHPQEGNVEDNEDASQNDSRDCKKRETGQDGTFGCLELHCQEGRVMLKQRWDNNLHRASCGSSPV